MINVVLSLPLDSSNRKHLERTVAELKALYYYALYFGTSGVMEVLIHEIEKIYNPDIDHD